MTPSRTQNTSVSRAKEWINGKERRMWSEEEKKGVRRFCRLNLLLQPLRRPALAPRPLANLARSRWDATIGSHTKVVHALFAREKRFGERLGAEIWGKDSYCFLGQHRQATNDDAHWC